MKKVLKGFRFLVSFVVFSLIGITIYKLTELIVTGQFTEIL